jgi:ABC-type sugar transport system permease subunit
MKSKKRKNISTLMLTSLILATVFIVIGLVSWKVYSFTKTNVNQQLTEQKIYFPPKDSPALIQNFTQPFKNTQVSRLITAKKPRLTPMTTLKNT